jgi:hypothetical protein
MADKDKTSELEKQLKKTSELIDLKNKDIELSRMALDLATKEQDILEQRKKLEKELNDLAKLKQTQRLEEMKSLEDLLKNEKISKEYSEEALKILQDKYKQEAETIALVEEAEKAKKKRQDAERDQQKFLKDSTASFAQQLLGINKNTTSNSFLGQFFGNTSMTMGAKLNTIGQSLSNVLSPTNLLTTAITKVAQQTKELAKEQDKVLSSFNKSTGAAGEYNEAIRDMGFEHMSLGVDTALVAKSLASLRQEYVDFNRETKATQKQMTELTSQMSQLGVSVDLTAKNFGTMIKSLGLTAAQADQAQREILATGKALGVAPAKMAQDFANASPKLAEFGAKGKQVFRELAVQAKNTGIEMARIIEITDQFDTFEGAAESVSRLNNILGGPLLDSMQMMAAETPEERFRMLKDAVDSTGKSFEDMDRFQKKAMASALGMKVDEMSKMMSADLDKQSEAAKAAEISQKELNDMIQKAIPIGEKLAKLFLSLAIPLGGFVDVLSSAVSWLQEVNEATGNWMGKILYIGIPALLLLSSTVRSALLLPFGLVKNIFSGITSLGSGLFGKLFKKDAPEALGETAKGTGKFGESLNKLGAAIKNNVTSLLALGATVIMIGIGIGIIIASLALLAITMKDLSVGQMLAFAIVVGAIMVGLYLLIPAIIGAGISAGIAAGPMIAFGVAVMMIGLGVGIIIASIALVVLAFTKFSTIIDIIVKGVITLVSMLFNFFTFLIKNIGSVMLMAGAMIELSLAMSLLAIAGPFAAIGIGLIAIGFGALAWALAFIKTSDLEAVSNMLTAIQGISGATSAALRDVSDSIKEIAKAMDDIPTEKAIQFTSVIDSVRKIAEQGTRTMEAKETIKNNMENVVSNVNNSSNNKGANTGAASSNASSNGERTIIIQLGDRVLKKFVLDVLNDEMSARKIH